MRVALLTTGTTELRGLPGALSRRFPGHEFNAIADIAQRPFHGLTSRPLRDVRCPESDLPVPKIIERAASLLEPKAPDAADIVIVFDDLELVNRAEPDQVCAFVRSAFEAHLRSLNPNKTNIPRLRRALRDRASFHLAAPTIESWFFAAPQALHILATGTEPFHIHQGDPEDFKSTDHAYLNADESTCSCWIQHRRPKANRPKWLNPHGQRELHPKGYLQWLLRDAAKPNCTRYIEGEHGANALSNIDWRDLLDNPATMGFARALIADLADALRVEPALANWQGIRALSTDHARQESTIERMLRNL